MKIKLGALVLLALLVFQIEAQTVPSAYILSWIPGLEYTDGTPLDESSIQHYPLYCDGSFVANIPNDFTRQFYIDVGLLGAGDHTCGISEVVDGIESIMSDTVTFPLGRRTPGRPTGLNVQGV
jgi:hypothetical protein